MWRGDGDGVCWVEEDPEGVATDAVYFGVPFFVGTRGVGGEEEGVGLGFGGGVGEVGENGRCAGGVGGEVGDFTRQCYF